MTYTVQTIIGNWPDCTASKLRQMKHGTRIYWQYIDASNVVDCDYHYEGENDNCAAMDARSLRSKSTLAVQIFTSEADHA